MSENKTSGKTDSVPSGFTLSLALVDAIPVILFSISVTVLALRFDSALFVIGAVCCTLGGAVKVLWKLIIAVKQKNIPIFNKLFRPLMFGGFALIAASVIINAGRIDLPALLSAVTGMPAVIFFAAGLVGMTAMGVMGAKLDKTSAKINWIEQCTNASAQLAFLLGIIACG